MTAGAFHLQLCFHPRRDIRYMTAGVYKWRVEGRMSGGDVKFVVAVEEVVDCS